ncbi:hypothetical protein JOC94_002658 [Bacillus thermophilus]|uniref:Uncharacterized protein n=1 Tax=Siminovitchia thermophila TaxID=1245522 RepID=A0ABS2R907_9BACI|nr:hypothetical protein [Siminovitchia thermophila]
MKPGNHSCLTKQEQVLNPAKYCCILKDKRGKPIYLQCISMPLILGGIFHFEEKTSPYVIFNIRLKCRLNI